MHVAGVLETVVMEGATSPGLSTALLLDGGGRLSVTRHDSQPTAGRVEATVVVDPAVMPSVAGRDIDFDTTQGRALVQALGAAPVRLEDATYLTSPALAAPATHRFHLAIPTNLGSFGAMDQAALVGLVSAGAAYWQEESGGTISGYEVAQPRTFSSSAAASAPTCGLNSPSDTRAVWDEAGILFPGVDFTASTNHLLVVLPDECPLGDAVGRGTLGSSIASGGKVLFHAERPERLSTLAHELGHNFSLGHAGATWCSPHNPEHCPAGAYDDFYGVMGYAVEEGLTALGSAHRDDLGLLGPGESRTESLPDDQSTRTVTARLAPRSATSGLRTLVVIDPETLEKYYVDYRSGTGRDADSRYAGGYRYVETTYAPGVTVHQDAPGRASVLWLRSETVDDHHGSWQPGQVFTSRNGALSVRADAIAAGQHADVTVTFETDLPPLDSAPTPVVEGTTTVGSTLRVDPGAWPDGTFLETKWLVDGEEVVPDEFGDSGELAVVSWMRGSVVQAQVVGRPPGTRAVVRLSAPVGPITRPVRGFVTTYAISMQAGGRFLSSITLNPETATRSYQWLADGQPIPGATAETYTSTVADVGRHLSLQVVAEAEGYDRSVLVSSPLGPVLPPGAPPTPSSPPPLPAPVPVPPGPGELDGGESTEEGAGLATLRAPRPVVLGKAQVGRRLEGKVGRWTAGARLRYQWLADGKRIRGATRASFRITSKVRGKRLSLRVRGTKQGYTTATVTSRRTKPVRR